MFKMENPKNFIREFSVAVVALILFLGVPIIGDTIQHNYTQQCDVYKVHDTYTTFIDPVGYLWDYETTEYTKGDSVKIHFHDNFTDTNREDDIIISIKRVD